MASNYFLPFASGTSANVESDNQYATDTASGGTLATGFVAGIAQSNQVNKVLRQVTIWAAVLGQIIADKLQVNASDSQTVAALEANLLGALFNAPTVTNGLTVSTGSNQTYYLAGTGIANNSAMFFGNAPSGYASNLLQLGVAGQTEFAVGSDGSLVSQANGTFGEKCTAATFLTSGGFYAGAAAPFGHGALIYANAPANYASYIFELDLNGTVSFFVDKNGVLNTTANVQFGAYLNSGDVWTPTYSPPKSAKQGVQVGGGGIQCFSSGSPSGYFGTGVSGGPIFAFYSTSGANIGNVTNNGNTGITYGTASDYRLKENVVPIAVEAAKARYAALRPIEYTWIAEPDAGTHIGFIAHELQEVYPHAVHGQKDAVDEDGNIAPQGVDPSKGIPHDGVVLINHLLAEVAAMKAEIASLKAKP